MTSWVFATSNKGCSNWNAQGHYIAQDEPRCEKTGLRGFRPGPTQTDLYKLRKELEA